MTDDTRTALEQIASGTPAVHLHRSGEHHCSQCCAYINLAREALGMPIESIQELDRALDQ